MKTLFTIGFTRKSAERFFTTLESNHVRRVLDVRLYNSTQLSGFAKYPDLKYFLSLFGIEYKHARMFAPSSFLLDKYRNKKINWHQYVERFNELMDERDAVEYIKNLEFDIDRCCLLCAEESAKNCHRRLVAELIAETLEDIEVVHLGDPIWNANSLF